MTGIVHRYENNAEAADTSTGKSVSATNDEDSTFVSVRERLRQFDSRQDENNEDGALSSVRDRCNSNGFPVDAGWKGQNGNGLSTGAAADLHQHNTNTPLSSAKKTHRRTISSPFLHKKSQPLNYRRKSLQIPAAFASATTKDVKNRRKSVNDTEEGADISVSELAKALSSQIETLKSKRAKEERILGKAMSKAKCDIKSIQSTLNSSEKELKDLTPSLNSHTHVSELIAERNRAAQVKRSQKYRRPSVSSSSFQRKTKTLSSMNSNDSDEKDSSEKVTFDQEDTFEEDTFDAIPNCENTKANTFTDGVNSGDIGVEAVFDELVLPSSSTLTEFTTESEGDGNSRYIQITLSSGGVLEKVEPTVVISPKEESSAVVSNVVYRRIIRSQDNQLKGRKGAKKFFFGRNRRRSGPVEI